MEWYWWVFLGVASLPIAFVIFMSLFAWYMRKQLNRYKFKDGRLELLDRYKKGY